MAPNRHIHTRAHTVPYMYYEPVTVSVDGSNPSWVHKCGAYFLKHLHLNHTLVSVFMCVLEGLSFIVSDCDCVCVRVGGVGIEQMYV